MTFEESVHNVSLTGNEISTILYIVEGYLQGSDDGYDPEFREDIDNILQHIHSIFTYFHIVSVLRFGYLVKYSLA